MLSVPASVPRPPTAQIARVVDTRPTVLITEQEVKLLKAAATAATTPARPGLFTRWMAAHWPTRADH
ncbi:hypothetical protein [Mycolicibacterium helvum]|uniref:hypothetical protein n=1 Tax=Mycolicibacterium helvum TaxID=1534349 RepID=UPI0013D0309A|nr:hypothetical protein [Mycolicibacterium helvum]